MRYDDDFIVREDNLDYARTLTSIGGDLSIRVENAGWTSLESVDGKPLPVTRRL